MGNPKQKWTQEEEQALRDGVAKYGPGKWKSIHNDPAFANVLRSRSNTDLKDKWRNLSAAAQGLSTSRSRTPKLKLNQDAPITPVPLLTLTASPDPAPVPQMTIQLSPVTPVLQKPAANIVKEEPVKDITDAKNASSDIMSSSSTQNSSDVLKKCHCGIPVAIRKSWTNDNPGRRFETCRFSKPNVDGPSPCSYWQWHDKAQTGWQKEVINTLLLEKKLLNCDAVMLSNEVKWMKEDREKLLLEATKNKDKMTATHLQRTELSCLPNICVIVVVVVILCGGLVKISFF